MKTAINVPNFGSYGDPHALADLAREAEAAGWDGFFIWDHIQNSGGGEAAQPMCDPWVALTAVALATERIRIGTMITPVPRRRPWVLARQTITLDRLSNGRLILGAGIGFPPAEYTTFGEDGDERTRGDKLDEGLDVLAGLWSGERFSFEGQHYTVRDAVMLPAPVQRPRIPVWVAGMGDAKRPRRRAARWDGMFPLASDLRVLSPRDIAGVAAEIRAQRATDAPFDIAVGGESSPERPHGRTEPYFRTEPLSAYAEAGATWWMESLTDWRGSIETMHDFVKNGPPS
jgi:probable F420-dependent oxidoreductase